VWRGWVKVGGGVDEVLDATAVKTVERRFQFRPRWLHERVDDEFPVGSMENYDVAAGPRQQLQTISEFRRHDRRGSHLRAHRGNGIGLGISRLQDHVEVARRIDAPNVSKNSGSSRNQGGMANKLP